MHAEGIYPACLALSLVFTAGPPTGIANPEGHLAAAAAAGHALTKNQKKKLKKKLKKVGSAAADSGADSHQTGDDSDVTSGAVGLRASAEAGKHGLSFCSLSVQQVQT